MVKQLIGSSLNYDPKGYRQGLLDLLNHLSSDQVEELNKRAGK
jgi:hypothetical protein